MSLPKSSRLQAPGVPSLRAERQLALTCIHAEETPATVIGAALQLSSEGVLRAEFHVESSLPWTTLPQLQDPGSNWGLWEGDVVELFVQLQGPGCPYFEFQLSPLGQRFQLKIGRARQEWDSAFRCHGLTTAVAPEGTASGWRACLEIPLQELGWDGSLSSIRGGCFAILGPKEHRSYWASFLAPQTKPDFHLPERFQPFFSGG